MIQSRLPTHEEAVEIVLRCLTRECRQQTIAYYRKRIGDDFADRLEVEAKERFRNEVKKR